MQPSNCQIPTSISNLWTKGNRRFAGIIRAAPIWLCFLSMNNKTINGTHIGLVIEPEKWYLFRHDRMRLIAAARGVRADRGIQSCALGRPAVASRPRTNKISSGSFPRRLHMWPIKVALKRSIGDSRSSGGRTTPGNGGARGMRARTLAGCLSRGMHCCRRYSFSTQ